MFDCDHPPKTIARFQVVVMLISQLLVISRCPNQGQLLHHFWYSSNPSVSHLWELSNPFTLYLWVSLLPPLLPELISCGVRWALVQGNLVRLGERGMEDMERETGPHLLLTIHRAIWLQCQTMWDNEVKLFVLAYPQLLALHCSGGKDR